ncbi:MAG TPA: GAF domain-containing protein [Anaerolineae bacterium]|nr:GAF domain-containing protein [Anaerolineae bacterium]
MSPTEFARALQLLEEASQALARAQLQETAVLQTVQAQARHLLPPARVHILIFREEGAQLFAWDERGQAQPSAWYNSPDAQSIMGWLRETREALLVGDFQQEWEMLPARPSYHSPHPPRSAIFAPLLVANQALGVISAQSDQPHAFAPEHLILLRILANQAAALLGAVRLLDAERRRANQLQTLAQVTRSVVSILDLDRLFAHIVDIIAEAFGYYHVQIFVLDPRTKRLVFKASSDRATHETWRREGRAELLGQGIIGWVATHGRLRNVPDVSQDSLYIPDDPRLLPNTRSEIAVALKLEEEVLGVLDVQSDRVHAFSQEDEFILVALADAVALAIANARLYEAQRQEAQVNRILLQVARALVRIRDLDGLLEEVARLTVGLGEVQRCVIMLWDEEANGFVVAAGHASSPELSLPPNGLLLTPKDHPLLRRLIREKGFILAPDARVALNLPPDVVRHFRFQAVAGVAMTLDERIMGAIFVDDHDLDRLQRPHLPNILSGIANQTAVAVERARLREAEIEQQRLAAELQVARTIQIGFLPEQLPQLPGYEFAAHWEPAREIGGDFYDFIPFQDGRLGMVVADVADKGVPAALYMALSRTTLRLVATTTPSPAQVLQRVNQAILDTTFADLFVTMFYLVLDPSAHIITYASGGHGLALVMRRGEIIHLRAKGMPLGILPHIACEEKWLRLEPEDTIILFTDGVTDAVNERMEPYGRERFFQRIREWQGLSAAEMAKAIHEDVQAWKGDAPRFDDFTLVVVRRLV